MEQKINIAELLKDCPQGMELDCPLFENLEFDRIDKDNGAYSIICCVKTEWECYNTHTFTEYGCYSTEKYSKCVIFPKGKTTWEGFVPPIQFKDGDVLAEDSCIFIIQKIGDNCNAAKTYCTLHNDSYFDDGSILYFDIDSTKLATKEEKEKLFQAIKDNGYKWNEETKTLEKLIKPWTIQDAKNGDILAFNDETIIIFKDLYNKTSFHSHCHIEEGIFTISKEDMPDWWEGKGFYPATKEQRTLLFQKIKEAGYHWNAENKTLVKLVEPKFKVGDKIKDKNNKIWFVVQVSDKHFSISLIPNAEGYFVPIEDQDEYELAPDKFDITTLKPFDKVLVRDTDTQEWCISFFSHCNGLEHYKYSCINNTGYAQCVPYEDNKHLLGKTDDCDEYFKNWK